MPTPIYARIPVLQRILAQSCGSRQSLNACLFKLGVGVVHPHFEPLALHQSQAAYAVC